MSLNPSCFFLPQTFSQSCFFFPGLLCFYPLFYASLNVQLAWLVGRLGKLPNRGAVTRQPVACEEAAGGPSQLFQWRAEGHNAARSHNDTQCGLEWGATTKSFALKVFGFCAMILPPKTDTILHALFIIIIHYSTILKQNVLLLSPHSGKLCLCSLFLGVWERK